MAGIKKILVVGSANMDLTMNVYKVPEAGERSEERRVGKECSG